MVESKVACHYTLFFGWNGLGWVGNGWVINSQTVMETDMDGTCIGMGMERARGKNTDTSYKYVT